MVHVSNHEITSVITIDAGAAETFRVIGYEWMRMPDGAYDKARYVLIDATVNSFSPVTLVLVRVEQWEKGLIGGIRRVAVWPHELQTYVPNLER
jgi:hypothetical protein